MVHPRAWNNLVEYVESMQSMIQCLMPRSSPDVLVNMGPGGITQKFARRGGGGGGFANQFFPLSVSKDSSGDLYWRVSEGKGSITDGSNGPVIDLSAISPIGFDVDTAISATKFIVLEGEVAETTMAITAWTFAAVDAGTDNVNINEIRFTTTGSIYQDRIRLLIGKVTVVSDKATAKQAVFGPQMITHGLLNGKAVKCFLGPIVHHSLL